MEIFPEIDEKFIAERKMEPFYLVINYDTVRMESEERFQTCFTKVLETFQKINTVNSSQKQNAYDNSALLSRLSVTTSSKRTHEEMEDPDSFLHPPARK